MKKIERRFLSELRAEGQGDEMSLVGYAAKFGVESGDLGGFRETIMPGAFTRSLQSGADVRCLFNHDPSIVLGRTKNGTLTLEEDATGLRFRCVLPNTQAARDLHASVKRGDIDSNSFAFIPKEQTWEKASENGDMYASRKLMSVDLQDVSPVTYPAYPNTELSARMFETDAMVEIRSAIASLVKPPEVRDEKCWQDVLSAISQALADKLGVAPGCSWPLWTVCETYDDYFIACMYGPEMKYAQFNWSADADGKVTIGDMKDVELQKEYVPSDRAKAIAGEVEKRGRGDVQDSIVLKGSSAKLHKRAAADHEKTHGEEKAVGNEMAAAAHRDAMDAHQRAQKANEDADASHKLVQDHSDRSAADTMEHCDRAMSACRSSRNAHMSSDWANDASRQKREGKTDAEIRAAGDGPPRLNPINLPQPFDSDMKKEWWDAFMAAYSDAVNGQKLRGPAAIAFAIAEANKKVEPPTEVKPAISGQGKIPTAIPHENVITNGDQPVVTPPADNPNKGRSKEEIEAEERAAKCECRCAPCGENRHADCTGDPKCGVRKKKANQADCSCQCPECLDDNCMDCSDAGCEDPNCDDELSDADRAAKKVGSFDADMVNKLARLRMIQIEVDL